MKKFLIRLGLFVSPFVMAIVIELFVLPVDFFNFRVWEAVLVYKFTDWFPGPFYPNMTIEKVEEGDLGFNSIYAEPKPVLWLTDSYGYRFDEKKYAGRPLDVVIIGDSHVVGNSLTENDRLTEVLSRRLATPVYPYAIRSLNEFINDVRFKSRFPKTVIFARSETYFVNGLEKPNEHAPDLKKNPPAAVGKIIVLMDRFCRANLLHFVQNHARSGFFYLVSKARHQQWTGKKWFTILGTDRRMLFDRAMTDTMYQDRPETQIQETAKVIKEYSDFFSRNGTRMVFFPIPIKSTVYYEKIPKEAPPVFLSRLIKAAKDAGVETVDAETPFLETVQRSEELLYQNDDTHWTPVGAAFAARLLATRLQMPATPTLANKQINGSSGNR